MGHGQAVKPKSAAPQRHDQAAEQQPMQRPQVPVYLAHDDYVDKGPVCQREGVQAACMLTEAQRSGIMKELGTAIPLVTTNYYTALQHAELELLLKKSSSLGFLGDLLLGVALAALTEGVSLVAMSAVANAARAAAWTEHLPPAAASTMIVHRNLVGGLVKQAGTAARAPLRNALSSASPGDNAKLTLIAAIESCASGMFYTIYTDALSSGDDLTLVVLRAVLDPRVLTPAVFAAQFDALLVRFSKSFDDVGPTHYRYVEDGTREVVKITCGTRSRFAVMDTRSSVPYAHEDGVATMRTPYEGETFVRWVADEFQDIAGDVGVLSSPGARTLDISDPALTFCAPVTFWALHGAK